MKIIVFYKNLFFYSDILDSLFLLFYRLTNPTILMNVILQVTTLFFFIPCILYNHCIPRQHPKTLRTQHVSSRYTAFTVVLSNNPARVSACKSLYVLPRHTSLGSGAYQKHIPEIMDIFHRLVVHFLGN